MQRFFIWIQHNSEYIAGFGTSSMTGSVLAPVLLKFVLTALQTAILAILSGAIGTISAHYIKKYLTKQENGK